jgi:hypothetical protein
MRRVWEGLRNDRSEFIKTELVFGIFYQHASN